MVLRQSGGPTEGPRHCLDEAATTMERDRQQHHAPGQADVLQHHVSHGLFTNKVEE